MTWEFAWWACENLDFGPLPYQPGQCVAGRSSLWITGLLSLASKPVVRGRCRHRCCQLVDLVECHCRDSGSTTTVRAVSLGEQLLCRLAEAGEVDPDLRCPGRVRTGSARRLGLPASHGQH